MAHSDRFAWLRRDGAPLTVSLVLHILALILIAPWLVMRTIPAPQVEVEVMLEPDTPEPPSSRPEKAARLRALVKVQRPLTQSVRPQRAQILPLQPQPLQSTVSLVQLPPSPAPAAQQGQGESGRAAQSATQASEHSGAESAPVPREAAELSAPKPAAANQASQPSAAAPAPAGDTSLQRGSAQASPVAPPPSLGSTPQPSARASAPSRPGEDREDGPVTLAGPVPQAQALEPEFRQASRLGGQASMRGGSQTPNDGLARQPGVPGQTALLAARAVPQTQSGSGQGQGGQPPVMTAPVSRTSGQGGVVATESLSRPTQLASVDAGQGAPSPQPASGVSRNGQAPALAPPPRGIGQGSVAAAEAVSPGNLAQLATSSSGQGTSSASRAPSPSGLGSTGAGSGNRAAVPGERGSGLMAAAAPATSGSGTAAIGTGPGASFAGEGRAQRLAGTGSAARDAVAPMLIAGGGSAAPAGDDSNAGQLSGRAETVALARPVRETQAVPLQTQQPTGQARVIEERFTATALKVDSPRSICSLPLMFAGLDRKPIPEGLDSINATAARIQDETPPRHHPGNQAPRYPLTGIAVRAQGRVLVRAEIRPDGTIGQQWIKQTSGMQLLDLAALETVRGWRFYPAQRHGMAVAVWIDVPIEYKMP